MTTLFTHEGNALILRDWQQDSYVGIAYAGIENGAPVFATLAARPAGKSREDYGLAMWVLADEVEEGLKEHGLSITAPIVLRDCNRALLTGDGEHYAVGVAKGKLHFVVGDHDAKLQVELMLKMRCADRP